MKIYSYNRWNFDWL